LYVFIGLALGAFGYYRLLSRRAVRALTGMMRLAAAAVRAVRVAVAYAVVRPVCFIAGLIAWPVRRIGAMLAARRLPPDDTAPPR
jgi:hypothetical protein